MLEAFKDIQLTNFSSLFEIAVTLNLVYVVAERAKQYGSALAKSYFRTGTNIENKFNDRFALIDKESVDTMPAISLGQGSTEGELQKAKRNIHKLETSKSTRIQRLKDLTNNRCVLTSFSFISFYMFLYSLVALFIGGLNSTLFVKAYFSTFSILSLVVLIVVSIYGERETPKWIINNLSLTKCCLLFLFLGTISLFSRYFSSYVEIYFSEYWPIIIVLSIILPYKAFIFFMIIIHNRLIGLSAELKKEFNEFDTDCQKVESHIHQLKEAYELSVSMESNNNVTE